MTANPTSDVQILTLTREAAEAILRIDPTLTHPDHCGLAALRERFGGGKKIDFSAIS